MADANSIPRLIDEVDNCCEALHAFSGLLSQAQHSDMRVTELQPLVWYLDQKLESAMSELLLRLHGEVLPMWSDMRKASLKVG